jgi:hypothetical protein
VKRGARPVRYRHVGAGRQVRVGCTRTRSVSLLGNVRRRCSTSGRYRVAGPLDNPAPC